MLNEWERTLNDLERDPMSTADRTRLVCQRRLYQEYIQAEGADWHDDVLQELSTSNTTM